MDERLAQIEKEKQQALQDSNNKYEGLLQDNQNLYNQQNAYAEQYEQKEIARQNKETEEKKARNDYFNYINPYGVQAESFASNGLLNSGVSETAKLGGYNTYQNRLASANKVMQDAFVQYDNDMNEARLNNDVQKAQNALAKLQMQLEYSENFYNQKSTLTQNQLSNNQSLNSEYYNRYNTEYNNIQQEKAREEAIRQWEAEMAEKQRQFDAQMEYQKQQDTLAQQNWEREFAETKNKTYSVDNTKNYVLDDNNPTNSIGNISQNGLTIASNPYTGTINKDAKYGVFEWSENKGSGYQPNNIDGVPLSKSKYKMKDIYSGAIKSSATGKSMANQSIWEVNGNYYVWDGGINDYINITNAVKKKQNSKVSILWGDE